MNGVLIAFNALQRHSTRFKETPVAKTYNSGDASGAQETAAKKLDGRLLPFFGVGLFVIVGIIMAVLALGRRNAPTTSTDAIQNAPVAAPGRAPAPTSGS